MSRFGTFAFHIKCHSPRKIGESRKAILRHKKDSLPVVVERDGKIERVKPEDLGYQRQTLRVARRATRWVSHPQITVPVLYLDP